jgi:peptidoglycan/LPS O-acetylase OafA/YrhL
MRRSQAVDALRAVAVLLVLLHHLDLAPLVAGHRWLAPLGQLHEAGFLGVSLFLVLSGFSIHLRVAGGGAFRTGAFLRRRFLRLHPTYYVAMLFAGAVAAVSALGGQPWAWPQWGFGAGHIPAPVLFVVHLTVLAGTVIPPGWLMVTWSLALEEQIYLVYAAVVRRMGRTDPWRWLLIGLAACLAWRLGAELVLPSVPKNFPTGGHPSWPATLAYQQVPARIAEWLTGALVAEWYAGRQRLPRLVTGRIAGPLTAAAGLYGVWFMFAHRAGWGTLGGHRFAATDVLFDPAAGLAFGALLACCVAAERRGTRSRRATGALAWLGERSYSLYLVHAPIVGTSFALAHGFVDSTGGRLAMCAFTVGLSVGCAALLYRYVEAPSTAWSKRSTPAQRRTADSSDQRYAAASAPL